MCGILGTIGLKNDSRFDLSLLDHRGPDGSGIWSSPDDEFPVMLGHTRLSIIDLSEEANQPMLCANERYTFIYNGEIYNFIELRKSLEALGHQFFSNSDTEVFFKGLIAEGPNFQLRCNGMWAFCLWDRKLGKALFGRDRFGKKPLFYSIIDSKNLVFASEMKAIQPFLQSVEFSESIDFNLRYLFDYESSEETVLRGIKRIPPGHYAEYCDNKFKLTRWWNTLDHLEEVPDSYEDQVVRWREIFLDAVKIRMRSDVRIGTALSGGLDSSATFSSMAFLSKLTGSNERQSSDWQHGFCAHFPKSSLDESQWAQIVTDSFDIPLQKVEIDPLESGWSIADAFKQVEDPYLTLPTPMLATYKAIANAGIKVTIDGHGADELFSGYGHLTSAFKDCSPTELNEVVAIIKSLQHGKLDLTRGWIKSKWIRYKVLAFLKSHLRQPSKNIKNFISGRNLDFIKYRLQYDDQEHPAFNSFDSLTKSLYEIFHITILPTLLRNYDRYSMASGVEIRMPFMDHRLVAYTFSLPWTSKVGGGYTKRIFRDAMKGILPEEIRTRRDKIGWNAPLHEWLRGKLKKEVGKFLKNDNLPKEVLEAWNLFQKMPNPDFYEGQKVWNLLMPHIWKNSYKQN
jgi:asparagine synthase (glutamine-hydrolysing)